MSSVWTILASTLRLNPQKVTSTCKETNQLATCDQENTISKEKSIGRVKGRLNTAEDKISSLKDCRRQLYQPTFHPELRELASQKYHLG